jgi:hypothetical protein
MGIPQGALLIPSYPNSNSYASKSSRSNTLEGPRFYKVNASSYYLRETSEKATDRDFATFWESDCYAYANMSGQFAPSTSCDGYKASLLTGVWEYPMYHKETSVFGEWIDLTFFSPVRASGYAIAVDNQFAYTPNSWRLLVKGYEGRWYEIHTVLNETRWSTAPGRIIYFPVIEEFRTTSSFAGTTYRLVVTKTNGGEYVRIKEFGLDVQRSARDSKLLPPG